MKEASPLIESLKSECREFSIDRGRPAEDSGFSNNSITTSRYTFLTFLPRNLFQQFKRIGNLWFLAVSILQSVPLEITPSENWSTLAPLCFIMFITMLKDAYSDHEKHKSDHELNNKISRAWSEQTNEFVNIKWKEIEVGNILLLTIDEIVPADCILIKCSSETCYAETSNLDGEDNLKVRMPLAETSSFFSGHSALAAMGALHYLDDALVKTEQSNSKIHSFNGYLKLKNNPRRISIILENMLLRGSKIKNTEWVICIVAFTGFDTKLMQNTIRSSDKVSKVEKLMNKYLIFAWCMMLALIGLCSFISIYFSYANSKAFEFFTGLESSASYFNILTFMVLLNRLMPISLYITIDFIKFLQSKFISWDLALYCEEKGIRSKVINLDLASDLGQVEVLFADKTGTITYNQMEMKQCSIKGKLYETKDAILKAERTQDICDFLEILALCHTVIPEDRGGVTVYEAASQDEEALVQAAHSLGYKFISNTSGYYVVNVNGENMEYRVLVTNELTSERKRMSVLIEPMSERNRGPVLYCKGSDSVMLERCRKDNIDFERIEGQIHNFAASGLRILVLAKKELSSEVAEEYNKRYITAKNALYDKSKRLDEIAEEIETCMELVGVSAIEDKVHEGVSETIGNLMNAGVKVCILTGDKQETATNIAYSTKLFNSSITLVTLNGKTSQDTENLMTAALAKYLFTSSNKINSMEQGKNSNIEPSNSFERIMNATTLRPKKWKLNIKPVPKRKMATLNIGLVVDGETFAYIMANQQLQSYLVMLFSISQAVIFGRVNAQQKAQIVKLVKNSFSFKPCTLAVGDGANDVPMLQEADIGIGILGKDGSQAANSSDFAIGKFQFLDKLILYQGRWNYHRTTKVILYTFYKNYLYSLPLLYFNFYSFYSGVSLYDSVLISFYNIIFTSLPAVILGVFDKDMSRHEIYKNPRSYTKGILNKEFNVLKIILWTIKSVNHSLIIFFFIFTAANSITNNGHTEDIYVLGTCIYLSVVFTANTLIILEMHEWSLFFIICAVFSCGELFPFLFIYSDPIIAGTDFEMGDIVDKIFVYKHLIIPTMLSPFMCICQCLLSKVINYNMNVNSINQQEHSLYEESDNNKLMIKRALQYRKYLPKIFCSKVKKEDASDEGTDAYQLSKYTLKFVRSYIERSYFISNLDKNVVYLAKLLKCSASLYAIWTVLELSLNAASSEEIAIRALIFTVILLGILISYLKIVQQHYNTFVAAFVSLFLLLKFVNEARFDSDGTLSFTILLPTFYFYLYSCTHAFFYCTSVYFLAHIIRISVKYAYNDNRLLIHYISTLIPLFAMSVFIGYSLEKSSRVDYLLNKKLEFKFQKGHSILSNLLPGFVKERVKQGIRYIADYQSSVTVLFCDICDFDKICTMHSPNELLELLDRFFGQLDQLCDKHGVTKIETVNKTYMVCGGLNDSEEHIPSAILSQHHAVRCLELALDILEKIQQVYLKNGEKLKVKIGMTTGPVIAGVVGEHKPQFSLVGDTVNTASRMCTTLTQYDCIQLSEATQKFVSKTKYRLTESYVYVKGKGNTHTFIVSPLGKRTRNRRMATIEKFSETDINDRTNIEIPANEQSQDAEVEKFPQTNKVKLDDFQFFQDDDNEIDLVGPIQWLVCSFYESRAQRELRIGIITLEGRHLKLGLQVFSVCYLIVSLIYVVDLGIASDRFSAVALAARTISSGLIAFNCFSFSKIYTSSFYPWFAASLFTLQLFISSVSLILCTDSEVSALILEKMYIFTLMTHMTGLLFGFILGACTVDIFTFLIIVHASPHSLFTKLSSLFILIIYYAIEMICILVLESQERKRFNINKFAHREIKNTEKLLNQMIPTQVLKNLHHDITTTDRYFDVTIIYADICGFTSWSASKDPIDVVSMLSKLFSNFDHLCVRHNVYKVHTIGDCYVILSFTDGDKRDIAKECVNMVDIALDMIKIIQKVNKRNKTELNMRIGMHTGEVIAGITGTNIVRYDIYGPDVDIANKTESNGMPGKINVSEVTKSLLEIYQPGRFEYIYNKRISHEPTNRELNCYFLSQKI